MVNNESVSITSSNSIFKSWFVNLITKTSFVNELFSASSALTTFGEVTSTIKSGMSYSLKLPARSRIFTWQVYSCSERLLFKWKLISWICWLIFLKDRFSAFQSSISSEISSFRFFLAIKSDWTSEILSINSWLQSTKSWKIISSLELRTKWGFWLFVYLPILTSIVPCGGERSSMKSPNLWYSERFEALSVT